MHRNVSTKVICRRSIVALAMTFVSLAGCGRQVTVPLPVPDLTVNIDGKLPGQIIAASKRLTADGNVKLVAGTYNIEGTTVKISDGTTVKLSGVRVDLESTGDGVVRLNPSNFVITFSNPLSVANVAINELRRDSKPVDIEVDLYESFRNLIALAITDAASAPTQPSENIVSEVALESVKVEMRSDSIIQLAGLNMHLLAESSGETTTVQFKDTTAVLAGKEGLVRGDGHVDLRLLCSVDGGQDHKLEFEGKYIDVSGVAGWHIEDGDYSASTEHPLLMAVKSLKFGDDVKSLALTPSKDNEKLQFVAEGSWADEGYNANLQIRNASVAAKAKVADGELEFTGNANGLSVVCKKGRVHSVKTDVPTDNVDVAYSRKLNDDKILTIKARLPKISVNLQQEESSLGVVFADLVAAATKISLVEKGTEIVTINCGNAKLMASELRVSGQIESIGIKLSSGGVAEFSDAMIDGLTEQGTGTVSCVLQKSALPEALKKDLGDPSLKAKKVIIQLDEWNPSKLVLEGFEATTSLAVVEQKARAAIEKKHTVESKDKYVSLDPVPVKLTSFKLTPAMDAIHIHVKGEATVGGKVTIGPEDLLTDLGKAVQEVANEAAKKAKEKKDLLAKKAKEKKDLAAKIAKEKADAIAKKAKETGGAVSDKVKEAGGAISDKAKETGGKAAKEGKKIIEKIKSPFSALLLPRSVFYGVVVADVKLVETHMSIKPKFELDCDMKFVADRDKTLQNMLIRIETDNVRVKLKSSYSDIIRKTLYEALVKAGGFEKMCADAIGKAQEFQPFLGKKQFARVHVQEVTVAADRDRLVLSGSVSLDLK